METMKASQPLSGAEMTKNLWGHAPPGGASPVTPGPAGSLTLSKSEGLHGAGPLRGLAAAIAAELMIGFWFGVGVVLAVKMLESLEYCITRKC